MSISFEQSFSELEAILEKMNSGEVSLDESLKLYEKADKLIAACHKRLTEAEKRIEKVIKNREGEIELDEGGNPKTEEFS